MKSKRINVHFLTRTGGGADTMQSKTAETTIPVQQHPKVKQWHKHFNLAEASKEWRLNIQAVSTRGNRNSRYASHNCKNTRFSEAHAHSSQFNVCQRLRKILSCQMLYGVSQTDGFRRSVRRVVIIGGRLRVHIQFSLWPSHCSAVCTQREQTVQTTGHKQRRLF